LVCGGLVSRGTLKNRVKVMRGSVSVMIRPTHRRRLRLFFRGRTCCCLRGNPMKATKRKKRWCTTIQTARTNSRGRVTHESTILPVLRVHVLHPVGVGVSADPATFLHGIFR